jgi:hypothetical protein
MGKQLDTVTPTGMHCVVRALTGEEINMFANADDAMARSIAQDLLSSCVIEVSEIGPAYPELDPKNVNWDETIEADRFWLLMYIRAATYKPAYWFNVTCGYTTCRHSFEWGLDIQRDLTTQPLAQGDIERFVAGNQFGPVHIAGKPVLWQLLTGTLEKQGLRRQDQAPEDQLTIALANRVISAGELNTKRAINAWLKKLDADELMDLIDAFDDHDGGIDTTINVRCTACRRVQEIELPLGGDFWAPGRSLRSLARKAGPPPVGGGWPPSTLDS